MKRFVLATLLLFGALAGAGCSSSPATSTFGIGVTVRDGARKGVFCDPPGSPQGGAGLQADQKVATPNLWVESEHNFDVEKAIKVRAFVANAYVDGTRVPTSKQILTEKRYDEAFGRSAGTDTFHVDFEGKGYDVTVTGTPAGGACP